MKHPARFHICMAVAATALLLLLALSLLLGSEHIGAAKVVAALTGGDADETTAYIVLRTRLPQAVTAALSGAALAAAGLMLQTCFANPLADPSILGVNAGASLGVAIALLLLGGGAVMAGGSGMSLVIVAAFVGAAAVLALITAIAAAVSSSLVTLIAGIMVGYAVSAVIQLLSALSTAEGVHSYIFWGMGSFAGVSSGALPAFCALMLAALATALLLVKPLNALLLGESYAENLGVSVRRSRIAILAVAGVLSSVPTAFCGPIAFLGLAVPHIARFASATADHRRLLPLTMLAGAAIALACSLACSLPQRGILLPLNVVTALWGVPVILYVLLFSRRRKEIF